MKKKYFIRSLLAFLCVVCLAAADLAPVAQAAKVTKAQIDALKSEAGDLNAQKKEIQKKVNALKAEITNNRAKKELLDSQINVIASEISNSEAQIQLYAQLIDQSEADLAAAEEEEAAQYALFCQRVRAMEEQGKVDYWSVLFRATSFSDLLGRLDIVNEIMEYDQRVIDDLKALQAEISDQKATLEGQKAEAEAARADLESKKKELDNQRDAANALVKELEADSAEAKAEMAAIEAEEEAILAETVRLSKLYEQQNQNPATQGGYIWPVTSRRVTSQFGPRNTGIKGASTNHKGIDIGGVGYTSQVVAAKAGTVIVSAYSSSYGNYVSVSHGSGNTTVYAHLSSRKVSVGQKVKQGDLLGITGSTGISSGPHLHFEIVENGERINPLKYLKGYILV